MAKRQTTKLSNQIIVRMDDQTKEAFMNKVQSEGKTASELIMGWIRSYIAEERQEAPDLTTMHAELQNLKQQVAVIQNELLGKTAAWEMKMILSGDGKTKLLILHPEFQNTRQTHDGLRCVREMNTECYYKYIQIVTK